MPTNRKTQTEHEPQEFTVVSDREIRQQRVLDAPPSVVFKAYTDPKLIPEWWGPREVSTRVDKMDVRVGGAWRYVHTDRDGNESAFRGEYREVAPPRRLVSTFEYEPMAGHVSTDTATFEDKGGKTLLTVTTTFKSRQDRDGMLDSGMEEGARETMDRLAELVESLVVKMPGNRPKVGDEEE